MMRFKQSFKKQTSFVATTSLMILSSLLYSSHVFAMDQFDGEEGDLSAFVHRKYGPDDMQFLDLRGPDGTNGKPIISTLSNMSNPWVTPKQICTALRAAHEGDVKALCTLGLMHSDGVFDGSSTGKDYYELAATLGSGDAKYELGNMYSRRYDNYDNQELITLYYRGAALAYEYQADLEDRDTQFRLAEMYEQGIGVERDVRKSIKYYESIAGQGDEWNAIRAYEQLDMYYTEGGEENLRKAKAALRAYEQLARIYYAEGDEQDIRKAIKYYKIIAYYGDTDAQLLLGQMYEEGNFVKQNDKKAFIYYSAASDQGAPNAIRILEENPAFLGE